MSSVFYDYFENTSLLDVLQLYWGTAILFITDTLNFSFETLAKLVQKSPASEYLEDFTDFEVKLLKIFSTILLTNLLAIFIIWRVYGQRICDRFSNLCKYNSNK